MRLLIADDEDYTREGLIESISWEDYGINEIKQARDGREALEISSWFKPDIVLTDIKMPKLNGIEFAEKLIKKCPDSKLLFISGYLEIDYLKSAIKLSAIDYIEKPINLTVLENAIKKAVEFIDEKRQQNVNNSEKKELQMQRLANMLHNKNKDRDAVYRICEEIGWPVNGKYITAVIWDKGKLIPEQENIKKINAYWRDNNYYSICAYIESERYFSIIKLKDREVKSIYLLCKRLTEKVNGFCIGIGFKVDSLMDASESYDKALFNVNRSFYNLKKRLFTPDDKVINAKTLDIGLYSQFNSIMRETPKKLLQWTELIFEKISGMECYRKEEVQTLFFIFAKIILKNKRDLITKLENIYNEDDVERYIMNTVSIFQLKSFILHLVVEYEREIEEGFKYSKLIRDIIDYIELHYRDVNLGVSDIAKYMHFSSAHLSVLFKHETGITIKQYICDYRLELSKKMLTNGHYKINEIAELCGYSNANYFAKVFKAATDLSPLEYRKRLGSVE